MGDFPGDTRRGMPTYAMGLRINIVTFHHFTMQTSPSKLRSAQHSLKIAWISEKCRWISCSILGHGHDSSIFTSRPYYLSSYSALRYLWKVFPPMAQRLILRFLAPIWLKTIVV